MSKEFIFELDNALYNEETGEAVFKPKVKGELIRCGECKYYLDTERVKERCALKDCAVYKDDFCSYGERKDGESNV